MCSPRLAEGDQPRWWGGVSSRFVGLDALEGALDCEGLGEFDIILLRSAK